MICGLQDDLIKAKQMDLVTPGSQLYKLHCLKTKLNNCLTPDLARDTETSMSTGLNNKNGRIFFIKFVSHTFPDKEAHKCIIYEYILKLEITESNNMEGFKRELCRHNNTYTKHNLKRYSRRPDGTRQRKRTTQNKPRKQKYKNFMLFIDHKTRQVYPSFQESKTASEACQSKCDFETFAKRYRVTVESYHADNSTFHTEIFQKDIENKNQRLNFSGINAQWQHGLVERSNGTLCAAARSMRNHAILKWDKTITAELWPFAIHHVATIYNTTKTKIVRL
jgi:hypothetical protein